MTCRLVCMAFLWMFFVGGEHAYAQNCAPNETWQVETNALRLVLNDINGLLGRGTNPIIIDLRQYGATGGHLIIIYRRNELSCLRQAYESITLQTNQQFINICKRFSC